MKNKKTVLVVLGIGVLLYLWSKGYFKSKTTPVLTPEIAVDEEIKFMDESTADTSMSPMIQDQPSLVNPFDGNTTEFDATAGEVFNDKVLASGSRGFGHVRRMR